MENKGWIYKLFNLEKGEGVLVSLLTLYSFFTGASLAYFVTSSTSLFLNIFDRDMLSVAFIVAGVIVWLVGQAFSKMQKKYDFSKSLTSGLGFLLVSIIIFVGFFIKSRPLIIVFVIYAWIRVFAYIHAVTFWGMAGRLFSLRQGKRLFGLISGGEVVASIISFFSVPFLLKIISTEDLLIISGASLLMGFFILLMIVRKFSNELTTNRKKSKSSTVIQKKKTSFLQNRYYTLFFVIAFVPIFAQFFVDYIFQAQAKVEYPGKEDLTAFVGIFFGFSSIVEFMLKTLISGRLMSRYGMKFGLMSFPIVMVISLVVATLFGFIYGAFSLFFSFIALGRLFTRAIRTSFNDPATQLLYQPIPPDERVSFQNKVESGPKAYASIVAGILLLAFAKIPGMNLVYFSLFLLFITILWTFSAKEIFKEYRNTLQNILLGRKETDIELKGHPIIQNIVAKIESGDHQAAKSMTRLCRIIDPFETDKLFNLYTELIEQGPQKNELKFSTVIELSKSEKPNERIIALRHMHKFSIYKVEKPLIRLLHDEEYEVKCEAIVASAKMKETELFYHLVTLFQNFEFKTITSGAIVNIGAAILPELDHNFQKTEYDIRLQHDTVELLEKIGGEKAIDFLKRNISHHNKSVRDKVIEALGKLKYLANSKESFTIWQNIENEIKNFVFLTSTIYHLGENIDAPELFKSLEHAKREKKSKIFAYLSVLYDPFAIKLIAESIESKDKDSRGFAIEIADMVISDIHKPYLMPLYESDTDAELLQKYMPYFPTEKLDVIEQLTDIINSEYWVTGLFAKASALKLLASFPDNRVIPILIANMVHPRPMLWQLSAYYISKINKEIFITEVSQNFPKVSGLKEFASDINLYDNGSKILIYERLVQLKKNELFNEVPEDELIDIATNLKYWELETNSAVKFSRKSRQYIILTDGELKDASNETILESGKILCPYFQEEREYVEYIAWEQKTAYISIEMHMINSLVMKYKGFAKKMIDMLWKGDNIPLKTMEMPKVNGIINA